MVAHSSSDNARSITAAYLSTLFNIGSSTGAILGGVLATILEIPVLFRIASIILMFSIVFVLMIRRKDSESLEKKEIDVGGIIDGRL